MKYGDMLLVFLGILFFLTLGFTFGVNRSFWFVPLIIFASFSYFFYTLKIKK